jgi:hypothetical protein
MAGPVPEPTELIYPTEGSWAPPLIAAGLTVLIAGLFTAWFWSVLGALALLAGIRLWWTQADDAIARMRRTQRTDTAVLPADPIRRS